MSLERPGLPEGSGASWCPSSQKEISEETRWIFQRRPPLSLDLILSGLDFKDFSLCFHNLADLNTWGNFFKRFWTRTWGAPDAVGLGWVCPGDSWVVGDKERIEADPDLSHSTFLLGTPSWGVRYTVSGKPHYPNYPTHILHSIAKGQAPHLLCPEVLGGKLQ